MLYGAFVWARGALNSQKRRFRARAGVKAISANAGVADNANCPERGIFQFDGPDGPMGDSGMMGWTVVSLSQKSKFGGVGLLPILRRGTIDCSQMQTQIMHYRICLFSYCICRCCSVISTSN